MSAARFCFYSPSALLAVDTKAGLPSLTFKVWGALKCTGSAAMNQTPQHCWCSPPGSVYNCESMSRKPLVHNDVSEAWGVFLNMEWRSNKKSRTKITTTLLNMNFFFLILQTHRCRRENQGLLHHLPQCSKFLFSCQKKKLIQRHLKNNFLEENRL